MALRSLATASAFCRHGAWLVALSFALPYLAANGIYERVYQRFFLPLLPFLALVAAHGWQLLGQRIAGRVRTLRIPLQSAGFLLFVLVPGATTALFAWLRSQPDTYSRLADWIENHLEASKDRVTILLPLLLPPLLQADSMLESDGTLPDPCESYRWNNYQRIVPSAAKPAERWRIDHLRVENKDVLERVQENPRAFIRWLPADYVLVEVLARSDGDVRERRLESAIRSKSTVALHLAPDDSPFELGYNEPQRGPWWPNHGWRLWGASCTGPLIDVLELQP